MDNASSTAGPRKKASPPPPAQPAAPALKKPVVVESRSSSSASDVVNVASCCPSSKLKYETCFQKWYTEEFLRNSRKLGCVVEWGDYQKCVQKCIKDRNLEQDIEIATSKVLADQADGNEQ